MAIDNNIIGQAEVAYLGDPFEQYCGINGKPLIGGHIEVFLAGTDTRYITYQNFDGSENPFKVPINNDGRVVMLADPSLTYDVYVFDSFNNLASSRLNVQCNVPGTINLSGVETKIKNTDGTLEITLQTSSNNMRVYNIDSHNKELGVEEPLYFVRDDVSATVIGLQESGYVAPSAIEDMATKTWVEDQGYLTAHQSLDGLMSADKIEYNGEGKISGYDGSALAGKEYEAGSYIDISNDTINVTGLQPSGDYASNSDVTALSAEVSNIASDVTGKMDVSKLEYEDDKITGYDGSAFAGGSVDPTEFIPWSASGEFQVSGDYYSASNPSGFITTSDISDMATTADLQNYQPASSMTGYQEKGDYYSASNPSGFITGVDLTPYQTTADMTAYQPVSAMTGYQPTGDYATHDDLTAYQPVGDYLTTADSANFYTTANESGFITGVDLSDYYEKNETSSKNEIANALTGKQDAGNYYSASNPSGFITGVDLTPYQTTADMTAYQPAGNYYSASNPSGFVSANGELTLSAGSGISITETGSTALIECTGGLTGDYVENSAFTAFSSTTNDNIQYISGAISGSYELSAGSGIAIVDYPNVKKTVISVTAQGGNAEVENLVTAQSGTWNSVTGKQDAGNYYSASNPSGFITAAGELTLSGVGGITVSETGTTALIELANTDLFVQEPLFTGTSGTSAYIGSNFNETVLWSGVYSGTIESSNYITLSESPSAFEYVKIINGGDYKSTYEYAGASLQWSYMQTYANTARTTIYTNRYSIDQSNKKVTCQCSNSFVCSANGIGSWTNRTSMNVGEVQLTKIVGVNRIV